MKKELICILTLLFLLFLYFRIDTGKASIIYVDANGGKDFTRIQDAIAAASSGDTIFVYSGIYYENIIIDKRITLLGEGRDSVIIDGGGSGNVIIVRVNGVEISEVCITNSGARSAGILLDNVDYVTVSHCKIDNAYYGIVLSSASYNTIRENIISNSSNIGINIDAYSHDNSFYHNNFIKNGVHAFDNGYSNVWYNGELKEGNYWDDYEGSDSNMDGIGDEPYPIEPATEINKDLYPLMQEYIGINILHLQANPEIQIPNGSVNISCRIVASADIEIAYVNITFPNASYIVENLTQIGNTSYYYFNQSFSLKGVYYYYVYARDIGGNYAQSAVKKFVIAYKPHADFTFSPPKPTELDTITFDASNSYDDDYITNYTWDFGDGSKAYGVVTQHKYRFDGTYTVRLTVYDNDGAWDILEKEIVVINLAPIANFTFKPKNPIVGERINFTSTSYDIDGSIYVWQWDFGDGTYVSGANYENVTHVYTKNGVFNVTLTVIDNDDASNSTTKQIVVIDISPPSIQNITAYPNPQEINEYVNISCNIYDDVNVAEARVNISFPDGTYLNDTLNGSYYYNVFCDQSGKYTYYIWAIDPSGNANASDAHNFTIITPPEAPHIENVSIKPPTQQYGYPVNISCYVHDNVGVGEVKIFFADANFSMNGITDTRGNGIYYFNSTFDMGVHEFYIKAIDVNGKVNVSTIYSFEIIDEIPPSISNVSFPSISPPGYINISCYVSDNRGVDAVYINISYPNSSFSNLSMLHAAGKYYINQSFAVGHYSFYIYAIDLTNNTALSSTYNFTVTYYPVANFTYMPSSPTTQDNIQFTDTSYDNDGSIVAWHWDFGDGAISNEQNPTHSYADDGIYNVTLTVTDNDGATSTTWKLITVENVPPIANFTWQPSMPTDIDEITFNASHSHDSDGYIANYTWDFGDGSVAYGMIAKHSYADDGIYNVTLAIRDNDGATSVTWKLITVANVPPIANFTFTTQFLHVSFNSTSYDSDGFIANYTWDFGDGSVAYGKNVSHEYNESGEYNVTLTVKDDDGSIAWMSREVVVSSFQLVADFDYNPKPATSKHETYFIDLSTGAASWLWDFGDGSNSSVKNPVHVYPIGNLYNVTLTVFNGSINDSTSKIVRVDTFILLVRNENNVVNYIPWLSNSTTASQLASLIGSDVMPDGSVVSRWNTSKGAFDSYIVGVSPPEYDFVIEPYDVVVLRVASSGTFNETAIKLHDRIISLIKNENNVVNHLAWSCLYSTTASQLASLIGSDVMPDGSVVSRWNTSKGAFDSYIVGVSPPEYDFVIQPGDCIVLRVANSGEFLLEVMK